jgi:hypothetical protein
LPIVNVIFELNDGSLFFTILFIVYDQRRTILKSVQTSQHYNDSLVQNGGRAVFQIIVKFLYTLSILWIEIVESKT